MYTIYLHHQNYLNPGPEISMPFLPLINDWIEMPLDIQQAFWPGCKDTLFVVEKEHLFDELMKFYGTRLYLQDWEGN
ncbi:hypothetical protein [Spirosoma utsteinense]|uniref:Uncharacterized protein n=1 Tax=Spirosoma utsteinense TaxID=2585773 RepID=A0ABR6W3D7_9BACT|nr:hypothetical protein [Spirosoma utsteinense]MBC3789047.1 hypothetical protein [Spirosoma utsteinense]MBC3791116.1 hypothetical protein [Spirosoma utsteinense]